MRLGVLALMMMGVGAQAPAQVLLPPLSVMAENNQGQDGLAIAPHDTPEPAGKIITDPQSTPPDPAQNSVLTFDPDALYANSSWGALALERFEAESVELAAENERLEKQFTEEEQSLTELRNSLDAAEFRARADQFDASAQAVRRERAEALRQLNLRIEEDRQQFFATAIPVMTQILRERGATMILDSRVVFLAAESVNITDEVIERLDQIGPEN